MVFIITKNLIQWYIKVKWLLHMYKKDVTQYAQLSYGYIVATIW